jgi:hypothetical protein
MSAGTRIDRKLAIGKEEEYHYSSGYEYAGISGYGVILYFPADCRLVALDIDLHFPWKEARPNDRETSIPAVLELCARLSDDHDLGQHWIYQTGKGWHVLFEKPCATFTLWAQVYFDACNQRKCWGEDGSHADLCVGRHAPTLRVGLKEGREPDIWLRWGKVRENAPEHVKVHHSAVLYFQQPGAYYRWLRGDINSPIPLP